MSLHLFLILDVLCWVKFAILLAFGFFLLAMSNIIIVITQVSFKRFFLKVKWASVDIFYKFGVVTMQKESKRYFFGYIVIIILGQHLTAEPPP